MSDFEDRIQAQLRQLDEIDTQNAAYLERRQLEEDERQQRNRERAIRAGRMGQEVVELLRKYEVPPMQMWDRSNAKSQKFTLRGEGWPIYEGVDWGINGYGDSEPIPKKVGIDTSGRILTFQNQIDFVHPPKEATGSEAIIGIQYCLGSVAFEEINDERFQRGIASLIKGKGTHP